MYYKTVKKNLSFNEAIEEFINKHNTIKNDFSIYDPKEVNIDELKFSIEQIQSNKWEVLVYDNVMNGCLDEIRDMMHDINLHIDSRFYDEDKLDIAGFWNLFESQFVLMHDEIKYELMKYYVNSLVKL